MANARTYLVTDGNGTKLRTLKTLAAAKKLAEAEGGKVVCDGEIVYVVENRCIRVCVGGDPVPPDQRCWPA